MAFEDTQAAVYLLRVSYSAVRAVHFMRTTPLSHWHSIATSFDSSIRRVFESLVGFPLSNSAYTQACLTPKLALVSDVSFTTLTLLLMPAVLRFFPLGFPFGLVLVSAPLPFTTRGLFFF